MARSKTVWLVRGSRMGALLLVLIASGCGETTSVVFPEPRKSADDESGEVSDRSMRVASATGPVQTRADARQTKSTKSDGEGQAKNDPAKPSAADGDSEAVAKRRAARRAVNTDADRPTNLADWTHDDFRTAKLDRDSRLVQAVLLLGRSGGNSDEEAKLLIELLAPTETGPRGRRAGMSGLGMAVAGALAANPSAPARTALKEILLGRLESDIEDHALTVAALGALVNHPAPDTDSVLYAILTAPEAIRPPGRGTLTAEALQRECVALIQKTASPQLRARLAEHVVREGTPPVHRALLLPMLLEPRVENVKAQAALALTASLDVNSRGAAQRQLGQYSKRILDDLWGVPEPQQMRSGVDLWTANLPVPDAARRSESFRLADHLWSEDFASALGRRLEQVGTPTEEPELWSIATSIPNSLLRRTSRAVLMKHWSEGAAITHTQQFSAANMRDPGMLAVLKSLPREDSWGKPSPRETNRSNPQAARLAKERQARQAWQTAARAMVAALNRRLEYAARVEKLADVRGSSSGATRTIESARDFDQFVEQNSNSPGAPHAVADDNSLGKETREIPILLAGGKVTTVYQAHWPEYLEGKITAPVSPLRLHYARAELEEQPSKLLSSIQRQLRGATQHLLENGRWIDSVSRPEPGKLRSIDVFVTRARTSATVVPVTTVGRSAAEKLVVEILWLEIDDFTANGN